MYLGNMTMIRAPLPFEGRPAGYGVGLKKRGGLPFGRGANPIPLRVKKIHSRFRAVRLRPVPINPVGFAGLGGGPLGALGKMTPEQEAQYKATKQFFKTQRKAIKGHKARVAAGVNKKTQRQALKMLKQGFKLGVPASDPTQPSSPVVPVGPTSPTPQSPIYPIFMPPQSTGSGGGGYVPDGSEGGAAAPASEGGGGALVPLALAAAGLYFLS